MRSVDGLSIPAWSSGGLRQVEVAARRCVHEMDVPSSLRDADGAVAPGALAILSDSTLGFAVMTTVPTPLTMATSHLHLELLRAMPSTATVLRCSGEQRSLDDHFGLAEGDIVSDDGTELARATIGAVLFNGARRPARAPDEAQDTDHAHQARTHHKMTGSPVLELLGARLVSTRSTGIRVTAEAKPEFANSSGGLHGGFGVLMGERVLDAALRVSLHDELSMRPVELRAAFLRPIVANGRAIECRATVMHRGRRLAAVRGEVRDHQGRSAVLVDATYVSC